MKWLHMPKKFLAVPAVVAVLAFGAMSLTATASSPAKVGNTHPLPPPSGVFYNSGVLYNSLVPAGIYSQAFNGPEITEFGNAVNLAPNGTPLADVTVAMVNFEDTSAYFTPVTFSIYNIAAGGVVGSLITSLKENVFVPDTGNAGNGITTFTATFNFAPQHLVLPGVVVYGITLDQLLTDCETTAADCGNDPNPIGSLNVALNANVSVGSDVYPGDIYVSSLQADVSKTALASNLGACPGAPAAVLSTFQGVPVGCPEGYGNQTESPYILGGLGIDTIPAVEFSTIS